MDRTAPLHSSPAHEHGHTGAITGHAAGVPFVAVPPPKGPRASAPIVVGWHLLDPPRTEAAFAAAVPLAELDAWRVYLGLPLNGSRLPSGGFDELAQRAAADVILNVYEPIVCNAAREFPGALAALQEHLGLDVEAISFMGGSIGAAVAMMVLAESQLDVAAAVLISPLLQVRPVVQSMSERFGITYPWSPASESVAELLDFVARAEEITAPRAPAVLLVVGEHDEPAFREPAAALRDALHHHGCTEVELATVAGMAHALADEPGVEPAPQSPSAAAVDRLAVEWLQHRL